ncbi:MAG: DUF5606 domain-containing protein [Bacteroidales bacterium]
MDLSKILSITGKGGLFKLVSQTKNSFIVESFSDQKRFPVFSHDGVATLDNISIFTEEDDIPLQSVMQSIFKKENGEKSNVNLNDNKALKNYFEEILPHYDKERVYVSNIKKVISWYNILIENSLIDLNDSEEKQETPETESTEIEENK